MGLCFSEAVSLWPTTGIWSWLLFSVFIHVSLSFQQDPRVWKSYERGRCCSARATKNLSVRWRSSGKLSKEKKNHFFWCVQAQWRSRNGKSWTVVSTNKTFLNGFVSYSWFQNYQHLSSKARLNCSHGSALPLVTQIPDFISEFNSFSTNFQYFICVISIWTLERYLLAIWPLYAGSLI